MKAAMVAKNKPLTSGASIETQARQGRVESEVVASAELDRALFRFRRDNKLPALAVLAAAQAALIQRYLGPGPAPELQLSVSGTGSGQTTPALIKVKVHSDLTVVELCRLVTGALEQGLPGHRLLKALTVTRHHSPLQLELSWAPEEPHQGLVARISQQHRREAGESKHLRGPRTGAPRRRTCGASRRAQGDGREDAQLSHDAAGGGEECGLVVSWTFGPKDVSRAVVTGPVDADYAAALPLSGQHLLTLLWGMLDQPGATLAELDLVGDEEAAALAELGGEGPNPWLSNPSCLHRLLEQTAAKHPGQLALRCRGEELSYAELNERANRLARYLRQQGVEAGQLVGLWTPRTVDAFVGLLAVLKAGAAYVPLDPGIPLDRVNQILTDSAATLLLTTAQLTRQPVERCPVVLLERQHAQCADLAAQDLSDEESGVTPKHPAYVIYTSGSTGQPKGVVVHHHSACNLVRAEQEIYGVTCADRVFQGFSLAFDASVEEIWAALYNGAALVVGTEEQVASGGELSRLLAREEITFFSTVPTLLSMMDQDVPGLRILILGGEECPRTLLERWYGPGRHVYNTYGPTETTVIATWTECRPGEPVTIGRPVPNYTVQILDPQLRPVPLGVPGELCIGGMSLAQGYLGRPELTASKFVEPPTAVDPAYPRRVYRSGDLARFDAQGRIHFLGRMDSQVKLRGFRIELPEIEARLTRLPEICGAAVAVHRVGSVDHLVAYVVPSPDSDGSLDPDRIRRRLREHLPRYMVPTLFELMERLPTLASGKVDRRQLPAPTPQAGDRVVVAPRTPTEQRVHQVWEALFGGMPISVEDDFFDLGGHSLLAAKLISRLRDDPTPGMQGLGLHDIYRHSTIVALARHVDRDATRQVRPAAPRPAAQGWAAAARHLLCGGAQTAALYGVYLIFSLSLMTPFVVDKLVPGLSWVAWLLASAAGLLLVLPLTMVLSLALKWALLGRLAAGDYPLWGWTYFRLWLVSRVVQLVPLRLLRGTPLLPLYYRLMGASIGRRVHLATDRLRAFDMVSLGDDVSVGPDAHLMGCAVADGVLRVRPVVLGRGATVGARSVLAEGTTLEPGAALAEQSLLPAGGRIPADESWAGAPARQVRSVPADQPATRPGALQLAAELAAQLAALALVLAVPVAAMLPGVLLAYQIYLIWGVLWTVAFALPGAALYVVLFCLLVAAIKWAVLGRERAGSCRVGSLAYTRRWLVDTLMQMSLMVVQPLYATLYLPHWLRLLGARIGRRAEIATVDHISADLLEVGEESFIADSVSVGPAAVRHGVLSVAPTAMGRRSFIGNSAVLPAGSRVGDGCLIGVMSLPPASAKSQQLSRSAWLGSPALRLPRRQPSAYFAPAQTFEPPRRVVLARALVEALKITLPYALTTAAFVAAYYLLSQHVLPLNTLAYALLVPLLLLGAGLGLTALAVACKWLLMGRYRQAERPLWSHFVWRSELINSLCENMAYPLLLRQLVGTPWLPLFFRLMGSRMGRRVYLDTTEVTEFDLVRVDDEACLDNGCTVQTHLFEDRVMKMDSLRIGRGCTVGPMAVVLYGSRMRPRAQLAGLSLLMKGETLPAGTRWQGAPARVSP